MVESWVCPNCNDQFLIDGRAYVMHRHEGDLDPNVLKFDIVVRECYCPCGATYNKGVWRKKEVILPPTPTNVGQWTYRTLVAGEWMVTDEDDIKARYEVKKAQEALDERLKDERDRANKAREAMAKKNGKGGKK